jgi:hypothetical protein
MKQYAAQVHLFIRTNIFLDVGTGPKPILVQQINSYLEMGQPDLTPTGYKYRMICHI